jgi:hypothetical protein
MERLPAVRPPLAALTVLAATLLGACCGPPCPPASAPAAHAARSQPGAARARPSGRGFLTDYARLRPSARHPHTWVWAKPGLDLRIYDDLLIEPIVVLPRPGAPAEELEPGTLEGCAEAFRRALVEILDPYYPVVGDPGPHALRVVLALTDIRPAPDRREGLPLEAGGAALEGELRDSVTGEVLVAVMSRIAADPGGRAIDPLCRHVEGAFREWARRLLAFLDLHHEAPEGP